jgi:hypothetical protein
MPTDEPQLSPDDLLGAWTHSHEEDPNDGSLREVYRPSDREFPLSRGRRAYDFREGNRASVRAIAPADGYTSLDAAWSLEPGNVLVVREPDGAVRRMHVESVASDRLVLRELLGD